MIGYPLTKSKLLRGGKNAYIFAKMLGTQVEFISCDRFLTQLGKSRKSFKIRCSDRLVIISVKDDCVGSVGRLTSLIIG